MAVGLNVGLEVGLKVGLKVMSVAFSASCDDGNEIDEATMIDFKEMNGGEGVRPLITTRLEKKRNSIKASRAIFTSHKSDRGEPFTHSTPTSLKPCRFGH